MLRANEQYFVNTCVEHFGENVLYIVNTDSYVRQPCYSARAIDCYYVILENDQPGALETLKFIQGEFPEFIVNYLSRKEIIKYPAQGKWQFIFSKILYQKNDFPILSATQDEHVQALCQALVGVGHIARHYYLRDLDIKTHTWAVRQLGWALKYAEYGILSLWNYIESGIYSSNINDHAEIKSDLEWLISTNKNWFQAERLMLDDVQAYKKASLRLHKIQQYFSKKLASKLNKKNYIQLERNESNNIDIENVNEFAKDLNDNFKNNIKTLYLIGSAARGDQNKDSDIDSIVVFDDLNEDVLVELARIIQNYEKFSAYTLSIADLSIYPEFRYYTLNEGSKKVFGEISFNDAAQNAKMLDGILNNMFTILQIARSYLLVNNYGPRSLHMLKLMMKLADHGCMRPFAKYQHGLFPNTKDDVQSIFSGSKYSTEIMACVKNINDHCAKIQEALLQGNSQPLVDAYKLLDNFVNEFRAKLDSDNL